VFANNYYLIQTDVNLDNQWNSSSDNDGDDHGYDYSAARDNLTVSSAEGNIDAGTSERDSEDSFCASGILCSYHAPVTACVSVPLYVPCDEIVCVCTLFRFQLTTST
jgi:hypothetical protein